MQNITDYSVRGKGGSQHYFTVLVRDPEDHKATYQARQGAPVLRLSFISGVGNDEMIFDANPGDSTPSVTIDTAHTTIAMDFTLENTGSGDLKVNSFSNVVSSPSDFVQESPAYFNTLPAYVAAGGTVTFTITFTGGNTTNPGPFNMDFTIGSNDLDSSRGSGTFISTMEILNTQ